MMPFSWKALLLAPLIVPCLFALILEASNPGASPIAGFFFLVILGSIVSYTATTFLFLPGLYLLSRIVTLRWYWVCLLGFLLGAFVFLPVAWISFKSSGPDSGPPQGTFVEFLWRCRADAINGTFPVAGLITAGVYCIISSVSMRSKPNTSPSPEPYLPRASA